MKSLLLVNFLLLVTINLQITTIFAEIQCYDDIQGVLEIDKCDSNNAQITCETRKNIGVAKVNFTRCNFGEYEVILSVNEILLSDKCDVSVKDDWKLHSTKIFINTNNSILPPCSEVELPYIYTGCYKVEIKKNSDYVGTPEVKYLSTNYIKEYINITYENHYKSIDKSFSFALTIDNSFINEEIEFDFKFINSNNSEIISTWHIECSLNSEICIFKDEVINTVTCNIEAISVPKITCRLENIEEGFYKMSVELLNDTRCEGQINSAWNRHNIHSNLCLFKSDVIIAHQDIIDIDPGENADSNLLWIVVIIALILIISCVIIIIYVRKRSTFAPEEAILYTPVQQVEQSFDIFLVYARDCDIVMDTMTAFKQVLEECTTSNVHDIHDPSILQDLSRSPHDWVLSKLSRPSGRMKTLLLASQCGDIQLRHPSVPYRKPRFYDDLFRLAVRVLADNAQCSRCESLFVLNFSAAAGDYESFVNFTPGRRFPLPENLQALLRQLGCQENERESVVRFREKCEEMKEYFGLRPDYVGDVLDVQVEIV